MASFYDTGGALSPVPAGLLAGPHDGLFAFAGCSEVRRPQVRPARAREAHGFGAPPRLDLGVVAGGEHGGDGPALPQLRPRILRIFEQVLAKTCSNIRNIRGRSCGRVVPSRPCSPPATTPRSRRGGAPKPCASRARAGRTCGRRTSLQPASAKSPSRGPPRSPAGTGDKTPPVS